MTSACGGMTQPQRLACGLACDSSRAWDAGAKVRKARHKRGRRGAATFASGHQLRRCGRQLKGRWKRMPLWRGVALTPEV